MPKQRLTDEQLLARDEAKVAKRRAKVEAKKARASSKDVRKMERDLRQIDYFVMEYDADETLDGARRSIISALERARASALQSK
jgi:hypothetical protein